MFWLMVIGTGAFLFQGADNSCSMPSSQEGFKEGQAIEIEDLAGILETHIQRVMNDRRKRIEVKEIRGYERIGLPPGTLSYEVSVPDQVYRGGNVSAAIRFAVNGKEMKRVRVTAQVNIFADVVVARSYLRRHHVIQERDLQLVNRNLSLLSPDVVTEFEELVGKRTTLNMNGQEVLRKSMVERAPLVKKGDRVTLMVENSHFKITALGEVQEEGGRGDRIRLLNTSSKREVYGRILDANTAKIDY